jgi:acyl carrier protein
MDKLTEVFRDVFDQPQLNIEELSRSNFAAWDSLAHVKLIIAIEEEFNMKFRTDQVANMASAAELRALLSGKGLVP